MSLKYEIIQSATMFGSKNPTSFALTPATLTASYADNRAIIDGVAGCSKLDLRYSYTTGSGESNNSLNIFIEESLDGINWFSIMNETVSSGNSTITQRTFVDSDNTGGATNVKSSIGLDIFYTKIRVSVKESGVVTNYGTLYMECSMLS